MGDLILKDVKIKPCVNEMEIHPHFQQPELYEYMRQNGIEVIGFCPLGSPGRPDRDRTSDDTVDLEDPAVVEIAKEFKVHPASIAVAWAVRRGQITIPQSCSERNIRANLIASTVISSRLTEEHMKKLGSISRSAASSKDKSSAGRKARTGRICGMKMAKLSLELKNFTSRLLKICTINCTFFVPDY